MDKRQDTNIAVELALLALAAMTIPAGRWTSVKTS